MSSVFYRLLVIYPISLNAFELGMLGAEYIIGLFGLFGLVVSYLFVWNGIKKVLVDRKLYRYIGLVLVDIFFALLLVVIHPGFILLKLASTVVLTKYYIAFGDSNELKEDAKG